MTHMETGEAALACKSDVNDALPSHLVFDMHCGGLVDNQETACRIRFLCLALLDIIQH